MDVPSALRAALAGVSLDEQHIRSPEDADALIQQVMEKREAQDAADLAEQASGAAKNVAEAEAA